jgi:hypothetical protein
VTGPLDVVVEGVTGVLDEDLRRAALRAAQLDPADCRRHALTFSWEASTRQFIDALALRSVPRGERQAGTLAGEPQVLADGS